MKNPVVLAAERLMTEAHAKGLFVLNQRDTALIRAGLTFAAVATFPLLAHAQTVTGGATVSQPPPVALPAAPIDPNAPPSWDVWPSFDYAAARHQDAPVPAASVSGPEAAVLTGTTRGPAMPVADSGPVLER